MKKAVAVMLLAVLLATGCARSEGIIRTEPRYTVHGWGEYIEVAPSMRIWAEQQDQPWVSRLLPDPTAGVWGSQDGKLFHFRVLENGSHSRATYGRPSPAAIEIEHLVWLTETRLAGLMVTQHLVRQSPDGSVSDVAPGRSPGGSAFRELDEYDGQLHLWDQQGHWYRPDPGGKGFELDAHPLPYRGNGEWASREAERKQLEQAANGRVTGWRATTFDRNSYVLVRREQLFHFDTKTLVFTLLDRQPMEQAGPVPVAAIDGRLVVWYPDRLAVLDGSGKTIQTIQVEAPNYLRPFQGNDGWLYYVPLLAVNLRSGEVRRWDRFPPFGAVGSVTELPGGRLAAGTNMYGSILLFDPRTGDVENRGRPLPELGQESGEEIAPIEGLVLGPDGFLYAVIGTGARGLPECHLVRMETSGKVIEQVRLREFVYDLVLGADGRIYGLNFSRVVVIDPVSD